MATTIKKVIKKLFKKITTVKIHCLHTPHISSPVGTRLGGNWSEVPGLDGGVGRHGDCYILGQNKMGNLTTALPELMLSSNVELALPPKGSIS